MCIRDRLNDGLNETAGPFEVDIEAGTYDIIVQSFDTHDVQSEIGIGTQPEEQFHIVLDSGYRSPATNDIPDDVNTATTVFRGQTVEASSTLTLEHLDVGGINSVFPLSVCFVEADEAPATPGVECETHEDAEADAADATDPAADGEPATADGEVAAVDGDVPLGPDGCPVEVIDGDVVAVSYTHLTLPTIYSV